MDTTASFISSFADSIAKAADFNSESRKPYDTDGADISYGLNEERVKEFRELIRKPAFTFEDLPAYIDAIKNVNTIGLDDREYLLEKLLVLMSRLEHHSISVRIQRVLMRLLFNDIPSPPASYLNVFDIRAPLPTIPAGRRYAFRSADGSNYNPLFPSLGRAGSPYARSIPGVTPLPKHVLPDPALVFDTLLHREEFTPHPGGISSLFFAFANLIIHDLFNTNHLDWTINDTSSYLDLSILYGKSQEEQDQVRRKDGTGKLWDDVFSDGRLIFMPPACCALLVLLSRNHNYIAQKLLEINENGTFVTPPPAEPKALLKQDDELFHRARLVNCGYFVQIILRDYVGAILGLVRDGSDWRLDPLAAIRKPDHEIVRRGDGNAVSMEFNLLYRWHSTLSEKDTQWTETLFKGIFNKDPTKITLEEMAAAARSKLKSEPDVRKRTFGGLRRDANGRFNDEDLAKIIQDAIEWRAGAFKARGTPGVMRIIELLGIEQSRSWGACSLNEFRKFIGLKPYSTFADWNPDPEIYKAAEGLYKDIDNMELYVGLQAENAKTPSPGAGLCPGYTISRAILGDAVTLTRGDRYLTTDFTPFNLTAWGFNDCQFDPTDGSYGGMLTKLLYRNLPDYFPSSSAYAHFPFLVPTFMKKNLEKQNPKIVDNYTWTRPQQPRPTVFIDTYSAVNQVVKDSSFISSYNDRLFNVVKTSLTAPGVDKNSLISGRLCLEELLSTTQFDISWPEYFKEKIQSLVSVKSLQHVGSRSRFVDIVQDVINLLPVHLISEKLIGLPLKTATNESGIWYEKDVYGKFADVGNYVFVNSDPTKEWHLKESSQKAHEEVSKYTNRHISSINSKIASVSDFHYLLQIETHDCHQFIRAARDKNPDASPEELAAYIFASVIPAAAPFSHAIANVVNSYLGDDKRAERAEIVRLASALDIKGSEEQILAYVYEALRLDPVVPGIYRTAAKDVTIGSVRIHAGERVFASILDANVDPTIFGTQENGADYQRSTKGITGLADYGIVSTKFFELTAPTIVGSILALKNIKRAPGASGELTSFKEDFQGRQRKSYIDCKGNINPFPQSLVVQYDL